MASIPIEVDQLTAEWLTTILQSHAPGATVDAVEVLDRSSGTTGRARLGLTSSDDRIPATVFVKLAPFTEERRALVDLVGMGVSEARFYTEIAPSVPVRTAPVWHADHDADGGYIMVLEDLNAAGASQPTQDEPDAADFAGQVMEVFAALHAAFADSPRFAPGGDLAWVEERGRGYGGSGAALDFMHHSVATLGDQMPPVFQELAAVYLPNADAVAALLAQGRQTLIHGDSHIGNMLRHDGEPLLIDWAMVSAAPGIRDVAYFVGNSIPAEVRREHEEDLVRRYVDALAAHGGDLSFDDAWEGYRLHMIAGWIAAVSTAGMGDALQPLEIGMRATERSNLAIEDLEVVPLLRRLLA